MSIYRTLVSAINKQELMETVADLNDRYGSIPPAVDQLIKVLEIKQMAKPLGFSRIKPEGNQHIVMETPMEKPAWNLLQEKLPEHLRSRFVYSTGKVTIRGLGALKTRQAN